MHEIQTTAWPILRIF